MDDRFKTHWLRMAYQGYSIVYKYICVEKQIRCWKNCWYSSNIDKCNKMLCLSSRNMIDKTMYEVLWRNISDFYVNLRVEVGKFYVRFLKIFYSEATGKGLGDIRATIGPTSDVDKIFSKMYSQYVLFRNKYSYLICVSNSSQRIDKFR